MMLLSLCAVLSIADGSAVIGNNQVIIGVNDDGDLNVKPYRGGFLSFPVSDPLHLNRVGLRNGDGQFGATEHGCQCEGWGVAVPDLDLTTFQNQWGGDGYTYSESFVGVDGGSSAVSQVRDSGSNYRVVHDYHTITETAYAIECTVTITNIKVGSSFPYILYRRVMDWDISPHPFEEYVTIQGWPATNLYRTTDNGFETADPLVEAPPKWAPENANFVDIGPHDHGVSFTFKFVGPFADGDSITFNIYYGVAPGESSALSALSAVRAEVYSLGQNRDDPVGGNPYTFFWGFSGVGGETVCPDYQYVDDLPEMTREEAQTYCQLEFNSDLASFTGAADLDECICDVIGEGSTPWVQLKGVHGVGFSFPDGTVCPGSIPPFCVDGDLWCGGRPLGCKEGSVCVRVTARSDTCSCKLKNDIQCDAKLTAVLCEAPTVV
eukprot:212085_1